MQLMRFADITNAMLVAVCVTLASCGQDDDRNLGNGSASLEEQQQQEQQQAEYDPCAGKACGESCTLCAPDDTDCGETSDVKVCTELGVCGHGGNCGEPGYDPCAGKACGESCTLCAPDDTDCAETANVKACNELGVCGGDANCGG